MTTANEPAFLANGGEMGARMRALDWTATSLGPPETWRPTLKAMVRMALSTRHPVVIFWGRDHVCLYNDAVAASLGPEKHPSMLGAKGRDAWPENWPIIGPEVELVLRGDGATWNENQLVPMVRNGALEDVYWTYSYGPIDDDSAPNGVGGVLVICTETTQQVNAERRLAGERERFAQLFEQAPTFMTVLRGPEHVFELANPGYMRLIGDRPILGKKLSEALPEVVEQGYVAVLDQVYRKGEAFTATGSKYSYQLTPGGPVEERYVDFVYQPIRDAGDQVTGIFVEGIDVTESRKTYRALRVVEDRLRLAVDASSLGTFDVNLTSKTVKLSDRGRDLFEVESAATTVERCLSRIHPADVGAVESALERVQRDGAGAQYRVRHRVLRADGGTRWLEAAGRLAAPDDVDPQARLIGVLWDVTEQQQLVEALEEADHRKDEFLATLAHELRNPLAPIRTAAQLLSRPGLAAERLVWCGDLIQRQSRTMAMLLDDLLDVSRITTGKFVLKRAPVPVKQVIDSAVETARPLIEARRHTLQVDVPDVLPLMEVDPLRIAQVLTNLLGNAAKYSDAGGRIRLQVRSIDSEIQFDVLDNGIGLASEYLPTIFEMFRQVKGVRDRSDGGLGIGLALSKGLVELHGGRIEVFSEGLGKGALFRVTLPVGSTQSSGDEDDAVGGISNPEANRLRILIADDNTDAADSLALSLELDGYDVAVAHDGASAFDSAARSRPAAALLDIGMPGITGYDLAAKIREQEWGRDMLLVATTGWGQEEDKRRAFAAGFDLHITKPIDASSLSVLVTDRLNPSKAH